MEEVVKLEKKYIKLSETEKDYLNRLARISGVNENVIKKVFVTQLMLLSMDYFDVDVDEFNYVIPYLANLRIKSQKEFHKKGVIPEVTIEGQPFEAVMAEMMSILDDEDPPSVSFLRDSIHSLFKSGME